MLDPEAVDLAGLRAASDDRTTGVTWWIDPSTGAIGPVHDAGPDPAPAGWVRIEPTGSHEGYRDMAEFVSAVHHRRAADLLDRAISGRGAFRRFKDTLVEFPDLRDQWFRFRDARAHRRALRWLAASGIVDPAAAERAAAAFPDPAPGEEDLPAAVAVDLAMLYGDRLEHVLVVGEENSPRTALTFLVVLTEMRSRWAELQVVDDVLWRHTERSGTTVTAVPVTAAELAAPATPLIRRAAATARTVA